MARQSIKTNRTVIVFDEDNNEIERFKFNLTGINGVKAMLQGLWSLIPFSEGLSGRNGFSDVDGHTEIDGHGLVLEFKQSLRAVNQGQVMKAFRSAGYQRTCTWFIQGETDNPTKIIQVNETGVEGQVRVTHIQDTDVEDLKKRISQWEKFARDNSLVKGKKTGEWDAVRAFIAECRSVTK